MRSPHAPWTARSARQTGAASALTLLPLLTLLALPAAAQSPADATLGAAMACSQMRGLKLPDSTIVISAADDVAAAAPNTVAIRPPLPDLVPVALPAYCRVDGEMDARTGSDGKPYAIGFTIALPHRWNGRFLFQGGGGTNGVIRPPLGPQATADLPALARGYAIVSTDSGHKGGAFDIAFLRDQEAAANFASESVGKVTRAAKALVARYYGQAPKRSYFVGCSTGGREGMLAASRHALEYDGVVAGAPAMRTGHSSIGLAWANTAFNAIAPRDAAGVPDPTKVYSASDRALVTRAILDACDAKDGLKDGMVMDVQACRFDPAVLACPGAKTDACLAPAQVAAMQKAFAGPKNSRGAQVYPPFPWDSGIAAEGVAIPGILVTGAKSPTAPATRLSIDVDQLQDAIAADGMRLLSDTAYWTNLGSFFSRGSKILFFHGWGDPWFSALDTVDYYERMARASGGMDRVRAQSSRFFAVPGMGHCASGQTLDRFDLLGALVDWVEAGKAPDSVTASGPAFPGRTRPLCAWPQHAHYKGQGNPEDAASFECR
jgi:feruloyl esterase